MIEKKHGGAGMGEKKAALLYIWEILKHYSSPKKPLTQAEIHDRLLEDYEVALERKAIGSNIALLEKAGLGIGRDPRSGVYYERSHPFDDGELLLLIDSVRFSRHIPKERADALIRRLLEQADDEFCKAMGNVSSFPSLYVAPAEGFLETLRRLNEAIVRSCKVTFQYNDYGLGHVPPSEWKAGEWLSVAKRPKAGYDAYTELHPVWNDACEVNPYRVVAVGGFYYLIGNLEGEDTLAHFRLDKITDITVTSLPVKSFHETQEGKNSRTLDVEQYLVTHPLMQEGKIGSAVLRVDHHDIGRVIDTFGKNYKIEGADSWTFDVVLRADEETLYRWALENGDCAEVIEPQKLRDRIRKTVTRLKNNYLFNRADHYAIALEDAALDFRGLRMKGVSVKGRIEREKLPATLSVAEFNETDLIDINFLKKYPSLKAVRVICSPLADASPLASLPQLKEIVLCSTKVTSIAFLSGMKLEALTLADDPIEDYSPLYEIKRLKYLAVDNKTLEKIDVKRLRRLHRSLEISTDGETAEKEEENYDLRAEGEYPENLLSEVFHAEVSDIRDAEKVEKVVSSAFHGYLAKEDAQLVVEFYKNKRTVREIAKRFGLMPVAVAGRLASAVRKLYKVTFRIELVGLVSIGECKEE